MTARPGQGGDRRRRSPARRGYCDDVEFSPEDGSRSDIDFIVEVCQLAVDNGATTLNIPDTVGYGVPEEYAELIRYVIEQRPGRLRRVDALPQRPRPRRRQLAGRRRGRRAPGRVRDQRPRRAGRQRRAGGGRDGAAHAQRLLRQRRDHRAAARSWRARRAWSRGSPATRCSTTRRSSAGTRSQHEAGIHQHGVLEDRETYEIIDASDRRAGGRADRARASTRGGTRSPTRSAKMGLHVQGDALNQAFVRFKELADRKVQITEADLEAIVAEELGTGIVHRYSIVRLRVPRRHRREADGDRRARPTATTRSRPRVRATA